MTKFGSRKPKYMYGIYFPRIFIGLINIIKYKIFRKCSSYTSIVCSSIHNNCLVVIFRIVWNVRHIFLVVCYLYLIPRQSSVGFLRSLTTCLSLLNQWLIVSVFLDLMENSFTLHGAQGMSLHLRNKYFLGRSLADTFCANSSLDLMLFQYYWSSIGGTHKPAHTSLPHYFPCRRIRQMPRGPSISATTITLVSYRVD